MELGRYLAWLLEFQAQNKRVSYYSISLLLQIANEACEKIKVSDSPKGGNSHDMFLSYSCLSIGINGDESQRTAGILNTCDNSKDTSRQYH